MKIHRLYAASLVVTLLFCAVAGARAAAITYQYPGFDIKRSEAYRAFMDGYPKTKFRETQNLDTENHLFLQEQLVSRNGNIDVFYSNIVDFSVNAVLSKGYYVPLQTDSEIVRYTQTLPPLVQRAVKSREDISQLPVKVSMPYIYLMNPDLLNKIGLGREELPGTFLELMAFVQSWQDRYAGNHPDITPVYISAGDPLLGARNYAAPFILRAYLYSMMAERREVRFDTPLFRSLLKAIAPLTVDSAMDMNADNIMFDTPQWHECVFYIIWNDSPFFTPRMELMRPMPLMEGLPAVQPISLVNAHLNPFGKNQEQALTWLSFQARYPDPLVARTLGITDAPLEYAGIDPSKPPLNDLDRYKITSAQMAHYRERLMPHLFVCGQSPIEAPGFLAQAEGLFAQYLDGALPEELFIVQLDNIIKLIGQEAE